MLKNRVLMVVLLGLMPAALWAQEPELTTEQRKLLNQAQALILEGEKLTQQGKLQEATEQWRKVVELLEQVYPKSKYPDGHPNLAICLEGLANVLQDQGEYGQAEQLYRRALQMIEAQYPKDKFANGHPNLAICLTNLATLLQAQGEYGKAETLCRRALEMKEALYPKDKFPDGHISLAISINNLADLLQDQGEYGKAEPLLRRALEMYEALYPKDKFPDGHISIVISVNNLAGLYHARGEYGEAETLYRRALEMNEALFPKDRYLHGHPHLAASIANLAGNLRAQGEYEKAEPLCRRALEMRETLFPREKFPTGHPAIDQSLCNLATLLHARGEYGQAEPLCRRALEMNEALYPKDRYPHGHPNIARSLCDLAFVLDAQGEFGKAEPLFRRALEMQRHHIAQTALIAPEVQALNFAATLPLTRDGLLSVTRQRSEADAAAYQDVWHSRALITRVIQRRHLSLIATAADDESVRKDWDQLQSLRRQREQLIMAPLAHPSQSARKEKLDQLNEQIDKAEKELLPRLPVLKHYEDLAKLGPDALQKLLPEDAVLVDLLSYTHFEQDPKVPGKKGEKRTVRYLAFVISCKAIHRVELGNAPDIDTAVRDWRAAITLKLPADNDAARKDHEAKLLRLGQRLRDLIWEPVQKQFPAGVKTVFLAPDGELTQLPWAALPADKDRVLLDDYALAVVPHGPFLLEALTPPPPRSEKRPPAPQGLLLVGGIKYDDKPSAAVASRGAKDVVEQKVSWGYLKGTEEERQLIAKLLAKSDVKLTANLGGTEAATERLRQELGRVRYAHLGTHGFFADKTFRSVLQLDPKLFERTESRIGGSTVIGQRIGEGARSPLVLSGLVCSGANLPETQERGILSADAIVGLLLDDLHLAVLSACDTGLGDVAGGEGVFGLQRAFHIAGCKNVVASLWKVDDAATAALMTRFYGYLFHEDKAKRLPAIEALRRAQLDLYRHPELIPAWSKGEQRAPGQPRPANTPPPADTPKELLTTDGRAPIKLWASFTLSGLGR